MPPMNSNTVNDLVYPKERILSVITLILGILVWLILIVGTLGVALPIVLLGFIFYLFIQSMLIAHIKGNGVELSETQFPDLYRQFIDCCDQLQLKTRPQAYVLNGDGSLNAFATKFLGSQYVVLMSDVVDAMSQHADGVRFYLGHELGHLRMKHLSWHFLRWPVLWIPLLGAAYSRARESTCDRHGLACSGTKEGAARALAALSAGSDRWKNINITDYLKQVKHSSGFWMSFHELTAGYPWLTKRVARVMDVNAPMPRRNGFAYLLAIFVPYSGRMGGIFSLFITIYIIGTCAAIAIPAYQDYQIRTKVQIAVANSQQALKALSDHYQSKRTIPESLEELGLDSQLADGHQLSLDPSDMVLTLRIKEGEVIFFPSTDSNGYIVWECSNGEGLKPSHLPHSCRATDNR